MLKNNCCTKTTLSEGSQSNEVILWKGYNCFEIFGILREKKVHMVTDWVHLKGKANWFDSGCSKRFQKIEHPCCWFWVHLVKGDVRECEIFYLNARRMICTWIKFHPVKKIEKLQSMALEAEAISQTYSVFIFLIFPVYATTNVVPVVFIAKKL